MDVKCLVGLLVAMTVAACGAMPPPSGCTPGEFRACPCAGGGSGRQTCTATGVFGSCSSCGSMCTPTCAGRECGSDGCGGSCGDCAAGSACNASGQCESSMAAACSPTNPTGTCPAGQRCLNGECCAQPCGSSCCNSSAICIRDAAGNQSCATRCTSTRECPAVAGRRCCSILVNSDGSTSDVGACIGASETDAVCRCSVGSDCASGSCAPQTTPDNVPVGPYICKQPACAPYQRCGFGSCPEGYCSMCDSRDNCFCAQRCTSAAMCGGTRCTTLARANGACSSSQTVCVP
jgi:hypothetical protein